MVEWNVSPFPHCHCLVPWKLLLICFHKKKKKKTHKNTYQFIVICRMICVCFGLMVPSSPYLGNLFSDFHVMIHALFIFCSALGWWGGGVDVCPVGPLLQGGINPRVFAWATSGIPGDSDVRRICLRCRRPGFRLWVRKIPWRRQ